MGKVLPNCNVYVAKVPLCYPNDNLIVENSIIRSYIACFILCDATFHQRIKYQNYVSPTKVLHVTTDFTEQIYIFSATYNGYMQILSVAYNCIINIYVVHVILHVVLCILLCKSNVWVGYKLLWRVNYTSIMFSCSQIFGKYLHIYVSPYIV